MLVFVNRNLPQLAVPLSTLSSHRLITDYICAKITNKQVQVRTLAVSDVSEMNRKLIDFLLGFS